MKAIKIKPIGWVRNNIRESRFGNFEKEISEIIVDKKFAQGLNDIDDYSHVIIVYWMARETSCELTHRPQGNPDVPVVGIFACRCTSRPNPIGITTVKLLEHKKNKIKVRGLDVLDKTPILDIKPYWPQYDLVKTAQMPNWVNKLKF